MEELTTSFFRYLPLAAAGLARSSSATTARKFFTSASGSKEALPMETCTLAKRSVR